MSCTHAMALGFTSQKGNMNGQNIDNSVKASTAPLWEGLKVKLVIPKNGYRYLSKEVASREFPVLNDKGVSFSGAARFTYCCSPLSDKTKSIWDGELIRTSGSAKEYVQKWEENFMECGTDDNVGIAIIDPKEGYYIEGISCEHSNPIHHNIQGPITDMVFAAGNYFTTERLKRYEAGVGCGYTRAKRVWQMLVDRQYDCVTLANAVNHDTSYAPSSGVTVPYFMSIWRDHGNISPEEQRMSCYVPEERGVLTVCCHSNSVRTICSYFSVSAPEYTNLLSCMWMTLGQPCVSPHLPFYIGINEVPKIVGTNANPVARVFEDLRICLEYYPEYRAEVTRHLTVFELQTYDQTEKLEVDVTKLVNDGKETEARALLTEFVATKCDEAMAKGSQWLEFLKALPLAPKVAHGEK